MGVGGDLNLPGCVSMRLDKRLSDGNWAILKKTSVSGVAAGWLKKVRMGTSFLNFCNKFFFLKKMDKVFLPNQTKKKKSGLHTGFNNGHLLDRKQKFF